MRYLAENRLHTEHGGQSSSELNEMIGHLCGFQCDMTNDVQILNQEVLRLQSQVQTLARDVTLSKSVVHEEHANLVKFKHYMEILQKGLDSIRGELDNGKPKSFDGTYIWNIDHLLETIGKTLLRLLRIIHLL